MNVQVIHTANVAVAAPTVATLFGYLPNVFGLLATLLAIVVYGLQVYDWFEKRRAKRVRKEAVADVGAEKLAATVASTAEKLKTSTEKLVTKLEDTPTTEKKS